MLAREWFDGKLGNLMFQYASLIGVKYKTGFECCILPQEVSNKRSMIEHIAASFDLKEIPFYNTKISNFTTIYRESNFLYDSNIFNIKDDTLLSGYFQNENYFLHCKDIIKKEFGFKDYIVDLAKKELGSLKCSVSVHVRRTDYLLLSHIHPLCSLQYYERAFNLFAPINGVTFVVCSDDIEWCKENFNVNKYNFKFIENSKTTEYDMCVMSLCDHNIIANSTYSWWGAWLGETSEKKIVAPKKWFGDCDHTRQHNLIPCEIVPKRWLMI